MRRAGALFVVTAWLVAANAFAQPRDDKTGEVLFREGRTAFDKGDFPTACAKFEASLAVAPAAGTTLNLAVCEEKIGKLVAARRHITELLAALKPKDDRIPFAKDLQTKLDARIPTLTLSLAEGAPADTAVREAKSHAPFALGSPLALDPGDYDLVITAAGQPDAHLKVTLAEGARETREIAPGVVAVALPPPPVVVVDDGAQGRSLRRNLGFVAGGVGIAGIGVAVVTGVVLVSKKSDLDDHCPQKACDATGLKLLASDKSTPLVAVNLVGWIAGVAGLGAGTVLLLTSREPSSPSAGFRPVVSPTYGGLSLDAKF